MISTHTLLDKPVAPSKGWIMALGLLASQVLGSRAVLVEDRRTDLVFRTDLRQTSACATQLLLTAPGVATRTQLSQLSQKLALQGTPLAGWVLLDPELVLDA